MKPQSHSRRLFFKKIILLSCSLVLPKLSFSSQAIVLNKEDIHFLTAIIPVILEGTTLNKNNINQIIKGIDISIHHMPLVTQGELKQLFWLMDNFFLKTILTGTWQNWAKVEPKHIKRFLKTWQDDQLGILDKAYLGLHDLCLGSWYALPQSWAAINYPGPPKI